MSKTAIGKFMNQKSFHPANFANQRKVWIHEQKALNEKKVEAEVHTPTLEFSLVL